MFYFFATLLNETQNPSKRVLLGTCYIRQGSAAPSSKKITNTTPWADNFIIECGYMWSIY